MSRIFGASLLFLTGMSLGAGEWDGALACAIGVGGGLLGLAIVLGAFDGAWS